MPLISTPYLPKNPQPKPPVTARLFICPHCGREWWGIRIYRKMRCPSCGRRGPARFYTNQGLYKKALNDG